MQLTLPIYWLQEFATKPNKLHLVGLNQLFAMHYQVRNKLKRDFHNLVLAQVPPGLAIDGPYTLTYQLYYKNINSDPGNIIAGIEKVLLDGLQESGYIKQDNPKYHLGTTWIVAGQDKLNPRCEITIKEIHAN
jgi:Holliday junction resolvase RusA-like endonuclease